MNSPTVKNHLLPVASFPGLALNAACLLFLALAAAHAGSRTSANYTLTPEAGDDAGLRATSGNYTLNSSETAGGAISSANYAGRTGFAGALYDIVTVQVTATPTTINETATRQLNGAPVLDDDTTLAATPSSIGWSVLSGPITSISSGGLATAGTVYQNTAASVQGTFGGVSGTLALTVVNVTNDDFGLYAADGLPDLWQVQNFGANNPNAAPAADPDGDLNNNVIEFGFGTNPNSGGSGPGAIAYANGAISVRGQPTTSFTYSVSGLADFRAVFGRRKDYVPAGLTYRVQFNDADMNTLNWETSNATPQTLASDAEMDAVSVPYPWFITTTGKKAQYFRVQVSTP